MRKLGLWSAGRRSRCHRWTAWNDSWRFLDVSRVWQGISVEIPRRKRTMAVLYLSYGDASIRIDWLIDWFDRLIDCLIWLIAWFEWLIDWMIWLITPRKTVPTTNSFIVTEILRWPKFWFVLRISTCSVGFFVNYWRILKLKSQVHTRMNEKLICVCKETMTVAAFRERLVQESSAFSAAFFNHFSSEYFSLWFCRDAAEIKKLKSNFFIFHEMYSVLVPNVPNKFKNTVHTLQFVIVFTFFPIKTSYKNSSPQKFFFQNFFFKFFFSKFFQKFF